MKFFACLLLFAAVVPLGAAAPATDPLEMQVADLVAGPQVTVVHFWAPWCPNCRAELDPAEGWAKFLAANPDVKVVFLNIWHKGQAPAPQLAAAGLGAQPNLLLLTHPNPSRLAAFPCCSRWWTTPATSGRTEHAAGFHCQAGYGDPALQQ
jgi:hypothetical protein